MKDPRLPNDVPVYNPNNIPLEDMRIPIYALSPDLAKAAFLNRVDLERARQIEHGYTSVHDDVHNNGELAKAATAMAEQSFHPWFPSMQPSNEADHKVGCYAKSIALLKAEKERIDRQVATITQAALSILTGIDNESVDLGSNDY